MEDDKIVSVTDVYDEQAELHIEKSVYPEGLFLLTIGDDFNTASMYLDRASLLALAHEIIEEVS